jgi:hypothetical protein
MAVRLEKNATLDDLGNQSTIRPVDQMLIRRGVENCKVGQHARREHGTIV